MKLSSDIRNAKGNYPYKYKQLDMARLNKWAAEAAKLEDKLRKCEDDFEECAGVRMQLDSENATLKEENKQLRDFRDFVDVLVRTLPRDLVDALLTTEEPEDGFCPACDAGVGHCNGPHKGSDEIEF